MAKQLSPLPRPVGPGSHLAAIAPSGPFEAESFDRGLAWLRSRYKVSLRPDIYTRSGYFAGDDARRLAELSDAIADPGIDAIVCARGGYGATRLLPGLSLGPIAMANKTLVGFSDITALHAAWSLAGVRSVHAPMVAALTRADDALRSLWISALEEPDQSATWELTRIDQNQATIGSGPIRGGNLAVLTALVGTPYLPPLDGAILFLEDVGERPYRIDRMLVTLRQAGVFSRLAGLVLGAFTESDPGKDEVTVEAVFADHFGDAPFPVLSGFPAGHTDHNEPIQLGARANIEGTRFRI